MISSLHDIRDLDETTRIRGLCAALAAVAGLGALSVGNFALALMAMPFIVAAASFRVENLLATLVVGFCALGVALIGTSDAVSHGLDAGWGDLLFTYLGTPIAIAIVLLALRRYRRDSQQIA